MANIMMMFPNTVEEFMEQYKMVDTEQIYSNGIEFVPIFRMKQWFAHQADIPRWIPVTERLPEKECKCLVCDKDGDIEIGWFNIDYVDEEPWFSVEYFVNPVVAWCELPEPYREGEAE